MPSFRIRKNGFGWKGPTNISVVKPTDILTTRKSFPNGKWFENEASEGPDLGFIVGSSAVTEDFWETVSLYSMRISCCDKCL